MSKDGSERDADSDEERNELDESTQPEEPDPVEEIQRAIESVAQFGEYRRTQRKECHNLVRRFKLMLPLMEEVRDVDEPIHETGVAWLRNLRDALLCAKELLRLCSQGSKIHLVSGLSHENIHLTFFFSKYKIK